LRRKKSIVARTLNVFVLVRDTLHREAPELARDTVHVAIDGPPRIAGLMRSALLAPDLVVFPFQPSPFDRWASAEILTLLREARLFRPSLVVRFVLNRCATRTVIARETVKALAEQDPPLLVSEIGQRVRFADAAQSGRLISEVDNQSAGARKIAALCAAIGRLAP
jgi:chromosome partitioning protein